ncbi:MAG: POTRA domain-containing protein [Roseateles sp.]|uniref:ShlB/FhaC/HecB family hemolysin secretion/activation protein n=1 Tax=Roseateles sp. TaxID=1971397 RepID=UPI0039E92B29
MNRLSRASRHLLAAAATAALGAGAAYAQTVPPGAGDTLRDLQRNIPAVPKGSTTGLQVPADADAGADLAQRFPVSAVVIEGNRLLATDQLQPLVDGLAGREVSLGELRAAARAITALYRASGFVVARAFVPAQRLEGGVVKVTVLEGSLNSSTVQNQSRVEQQVLDDIVAAQHMNGKVIRNAAMDRTLLLLADLPGVGPVNGLLKPGQAVGTSDLLIPVQPGKDREGEVSVDNYGNRYTGAYRANGRLDLLSPLHIGDRLSLRATATSERLLYGRIAYDLPGNDDGLRVGVDASSSQYHLGKEFAALDAEGHADTVGATALYPLVRGLVANVWVSGAAEHRWLRDRTGATDTTTKKGLDAATVTLYGDLADALGGGAYSTWTLSTVLGRLDIRSAAARAADQAGPRAQGGYMKLTGAVTRLQAITATTSAYLALSGQAANKNLDSSEKFVIGGLYGVRAYPQGEGAGDDGWLGSVELRQAIAGVAQASVFYDQGHVRYQNKPYATGVSGQTLKGYGVGLAGLWRDFNVRAVLAWRDAAKSLTAPDRSPRLWVSAGWSL